MMTLVMDQINGHLYQTPSHIRLWILAVQAVQGNLTSGNSKIGSEN
jgi:hypothetical protein